MMGANNIIRKFSLVALILFSMAETDVSAQSETWKYGEKEFTFIQLMTVASVIGDLKPIAMPYYQVKAYNSEAISDAKNVYTAWKDYPDNSASAALDFKQSENTVVCINFDNNGGISGFSAYHMSGDKSFHIDLAGKITLEEWDFCYK